MAQENALWLAERTQMHKQFTTGEVVGITRIPLKSIQRYIKQFPEGFSDKATHPKI
jgi:hypothetical protein